MQASELEERITKAVQQGIQSMGKDGSVRPESVQVVGQIGDRNRNHQLQPNKIQKFHQDGGDVDSGWVQGDESKSGIWRPLDEGLNMTRPEDVPIVKKYRLAIHEVHDVKLTLQNQLITNAHRKDKRDALVDKLNSTIMDSLKQVKKLSKDFKDSIRTEELGVNHTKVADIKQEYIEDLELKGRKDVLRNAKKLVRTYKDSNIATKSIAWNSYWNGLSKDGETLWRQVWLSTVNATNRILGPAWQEGRINVVKWMDDRLKKDELLYMDESMIDRIEYGGSLAKGYKGPPKQHIRFLPEKFDVDANLIAPPLALYSINNGVAIDRGTLKSDKVPALREFEQDTHDKLKGILGYDEDEPFEVFIDTRGVRDLHTRFGKDHTINSEQAVQKIGQEKSINDIKNRLWRLRSEVTPAVFSRVAQNIKTSFNYVYKQLKIQKNVVVLDNSAINEIVLHVSADNEVEVDDILQIIESAIDGAR